MYQTVLRSVNGYTAIGANGEKLQFVGNWYGSPGDTVWTDGNIIFGHSPLRASSTMMVLPANIGIPVSCDNLRGYFSLTGVWNSYDVAQQDWIVNNENYFFSGSDSNVKDAAISDKGDLYLVTGGKYAEYQLILKDDRSTAQIPDPQKAMWAYLGSPIGIEHTFYFRLAEGELLLSTGESYSFGMTFPNLQIPLVISKNGTKIAEIDLTPFVDSLKRKFSNLRTKMINENDQLSDWTMDNETITALRVGIYTLSLDKNGDISYSVFGSITGYYNVDVHSWTGLWEYWEGVEWQEANIWLPCGVSCLYSSDVETISEHIYGGLQQTTINTVTENSSVMKNNYIGVVRTPFVDGAHYYIRYPDGSLSSRFWYYEETALSGNSGGQPLKEGESWYVLEYDEVDLSIFYAAEVASNAVGTMDVEINLGATSTGAGTFSVQMSGGSCTISKYGLASFYDSQNKTIAENVVVDDDYLCVEINSYDLDKKDIYTGFTLQGRQLIVNYKIYTPDGKITEKTANLNDLEVDVDADGIPLMDGYYTRGTNGELTPFYFKPILKKLSDNVYLFGTHGGKLYIKTKSGIQKVGEGLKNFRLEVLNDISKAKG